jgi:hypothetical protein
MKDYEKHLEKLRIDAAECALIRDLATDKAKRDLFDRLAGHLTVLADQVEHEMLERKRPAAEPKTYGDRHHRAGACLPASST